jgi:4-diphosphocytidyl-2-C-methyl-D-erythritol kinase
MQVEKQSPCKVNLILNILGKRPDGFHELETVMQPVPIYDTLTISNAREGITLTCNHPDLPTDAQNLVWRAADKFFSVANISEGAEIHLEKRLPVAAGLGGGSANAAVTLLGLNELFGSPLSPEQLFHLAAELGSDVPFFLQQNPAIATGRGEKVQSLPEFQALKGVHIILVHPGFGVSTAWAYKNLARFPEALNGLPNRATRLVERLNSGDIQSALPEFYNSLEAPVLEKYPILAMFQEWFRTNGAIMSMMSGSGSTTFALAQNESIAADLKSRFVAEFGDFCWIASVPL